MANLTEFTESAAPTAADAQLALTSSRQFARLVRKSKASKRVVFRMPGRGGSVEEVALPAPAFKLIADMLAEMAKGNGVALIPTRAELTTTQAAELLNVSRPFLIEQLEKGLIPHRKVGRHRRIFFRDAMRYKRSMDAGRLKALGELSAIDQELGLGY